jgi:hypothetical protein
MLGNDLTSLAAVGSALRHCPECAHGATRTMLVIPATPGQTKQFRKSILFRRRYVYARTLVIATVGLAFGEMSAFD